MQEHRFDECEPINLLNREIMIDRQIPTHEHQLLRYCVQITCDLLISALHKTVDFYFTFFLSQPQHTTTEQRLIEDDRRE